MSFVKVAFISLIGSRRFFQEARGERKPLWIFIFSTYVRPSARKEFHIIVEYQQKMYLILEDGIDLTFSEKATEHAFIVNFREREPCTGNAARIPEPPIGALFSSSLIGLGFQVRKRKEAFSRKFD
jgi:hypothetical protein